GGAARGRIRVGMSVAELFHEAAGWFSCAGHPEPRPHPEALVVVTPGAVEAHGFGESDVTFHYSSPDELAGVLSKVIQGSRGKWVFTFGYVAMPTREYFDVVLDPEAKVASVSPVRPGLD